VALPSDAGVASSSGVTKTASLTLPVSWELDLFGRRSTTGRVADADVAAAGFDVEAARAAIAAEVARSLFQTRGLLVQRDEARETVRIQRELLRVVVERAARGISASSEADRIAGDVAQAEAQAVDLDAAQTASRRALLAVIGGGTDPLATLNVSPALGVVPAVPAAMPSDLLARRPDVRLAAAHIQKSASSVRLAELDFFPRLTLNPGAGLSMQRGAFDTTTGFWSIAAGLVVPILDRRRLHAQLRAESARAEQAVLAYERAVQTAFSEADQALVRLAADRRRVDLLVAGESRARKAYDAALKRYQLGFADLTELLDAERAWRATRVALTIARIDALQRSVQVFQALGGGWDGATPAADLAKVEKNE
jgi:NodT family efflux transporter outer membrane factor (OMF) lipoprotein